MEAFLVKKKPNSNNDENANPGGASAAASKSLKMSKAGGSAAQTVLQEKKPSNQQPSVANGADAAAGGEKKKSGGKKKKAVEEIYQKKTQLEHILLRPDTYIGSVERESDKIWVLNSDNTKVQWRVIPFHLDVHRIRAVALHLAFLLFCLTLVIPPSIPLARWC